MALMIEYIVAKSTDLTLKEPVTIQKQIGATVSGVDSKIMTEADALAEVTKAIPLDSKTTEPIAVKYYRHVCNHDAPNGKGCQLIEINPLMEGVK